LSSPLGVALGLVTAVCWAISPLCYSAAGRRIGSFAVAVIRVILASVFLLITLPLYRLALGHDLPLPNQTQFAWLCASGLSGMVLGDLCYFEALVRLGPRRSSQLQVVAPVVSVLIGWGLGEQLPLQAVLGVAIALSASFYAVLGERELLAPRQQRSREPGALSPMGIGLALAGAAFTGLGAVLTREAFRIPNPMDAVVATFARVGFSALLLSLIPILSGRSGRMLALLGDRVAMKGILVGSVVGPYLGMLTYIAALQRLQAGLVSTLSTLSPVFVLPMVAWVYGARIGKRVVLASLLAALGVALIAWR
jgi:drug/metabolite transporter (DMT)-like permease